MIKLEPWVILLSIAAWGAWAGSKVACGESEKPVTTVQRVAFFIASPVIALLSPLIVVLFIEIVMNGAWKAYVSRLDKNPIKPT